MKKFEVGKVYYTRFIGDSDSKLQFEILKRTAKRVTIQNMFDKSETVTVGVKPNYDGSAETCFPLGRYSMAPMLDAGRMV